MARGSIAGVRARWWLPPFVLVLALVLAAVGLVWWVRTPGPLAHADVVLVLGGDGERLDRGLALARAGVAPVLVLSSGVEGGGCRRAGERRHRGDDPPTVAGVRVLCLDPMPFTTQGEARGFAALAQANGWHSVDIVATTDQANRALLRVRRCWSGTEGFSLIPAAHDVLYASVYQLGGWAKALVTERSC